MKNLRSQLTQKYRAKWETHRTNVAKLSLKDWRVLLATWFGCGTFFPGPGFWGTLGALPLGIVLLVLGGQVYVLAASIILLAIGVHVTRHTENILKTHDSSIIVIDEAAGVMIPLAFVPLTPMGIVMAFLAFRIFDVWKPFPISYLDKRMGGAWGVMIDDIVAGIFAAIVMVIWSIYGINTNTL
ncbi:MAG: phosphatidylglycerophosphatase A [Micavibrio sp.]|nr:phosphatidylglycerophosphatase A [Micavibrio sp.]|tara:strand:- start:177 stop:728 length:552 start_codon:yes stop_codon:yes gene_type:complete